MALQQHVSTRSRPAFSGLRVSHAAARPVVMSRRGAGGNSVSVKAMIREWPDKDFIAETLSIFPDEGVANAEQARVRPGTECITVAADEAQSGLDQQHHNGSAQRVAAIAGQTAKA